MSWPPGLKSGYLYHKLDRAKDESEKGCEL